MKLDSLISKLKSNTNNTNNMCAATFNNKKILTYGYSDFNRSTAFGINKFGLHAEEDAIRKLYSKYAKYFARIICGKMKFKTKKNIDLVVIKINNEGEFTNSKCCIVCYSIMKAFNIRNIYYFKDNKLIKDKLTHFNPDYISSGYDFYLSAHNITNNNLLYVIKNVSLTISKNHNLYPYNIKY